MPKRMKVEGGQTSEEVDAVYKRCTNPHDQKRLLALQMAQQAQWTMQQIAQSIGKGSATLGRWIKAYRQEGLG